MNAGVKPNSFTFDILIRACNFKGAGKWEKAMTAMKRLMDAGIEMPDSIVEALMGVCDNAMRKAQRWVSSHPYLVAVTVAQAKQRKMPYTCTPTSTYTYIDTYAHTHLHTHIHIPIHAHKQIHILIHVAADTVLRTL